MSRVDPIDPRVRLEIVRWPEDAPRGAVTTFCEAAGISRKTFYEIRRRALTEGEAAALEPRSRRPKTTPSSVTAAVKADAIGVRGALERSGLDHGPISVHDKMLAMGLSAPSTAALSRIFREAGVARTEPRKRPRAAWRRFVYPAPNACWQLDATEYVLARGRRCVIFQLIDDHSRLAVASLVADGETSEAAITVVARGIERHGVPQRLLSDNGAALNPSRRGVIGQLVAHVTALGVEAITGKPYKPTTQGKNERFHQTLFRWLDQQSLAASIGELQTQVDEFDRIYNTERPHQGLPGRITPQAAWEATPKAEPPRPRPAPARGSRPLTPTDRPDPDSDPSTIRVRRNGAVSLHGITFQIDRRRAGETLNVIASAQSIAFADTAGTIIIEHHWPEPGIRYLGNGKPFRRRRDDLEPSPMS